MLDSDESGPVSRRDVLRATGTAAGVATLGGVASADESGEFNIGIAPGAASAERQAKRRAESVRKTIDFGDLGRVVVGEFTAEARSALEKNPKVDYVEPNYTAEKLSETLPVGVDRIDADKLHANGDTGSGAVVAILDTGVDDDHPDLKANVDPTLGAAFGSECGSESGGCRFGLEGYNGNDCNYKWSDDDDHGSHVAGTADADDNSKGVIGVATESTIMPVKVLSGCGSGSYADIADGIKYAADNGADVINMSLGGSSGDSTLKNACQYAYDRDVLLVAAAGNDGPCSDCVSYPAKYSTVMAISAMDPRDDTLADFSSTGPEIELTAPGVDTLSTIPPESEDDSNDGYEKFSGTSMASPHVAGTAGQVYAKADSDLTNKEIRKQLKDTAEDIGLSSNESGAGLVDAEAAVGSLSSDPSPTVESLSASEVETSDGDAEFDVSWSVSDGEGDLSSVDIALIDSSGSTEDSVSVSVSGSSASGTNRLIAAGDEGTGDSYTVELTVTDSNSNSTTSSVSVSESEDSPTVDSLSASEVETSDSDAEFDVSWDVSDADGDLSSVDLSLTDDTDSESEDSVTVSVSGSSASGTDRLVAAGDDGSGNSYTITATVSDTDGTSGSGSTTISESESTNSAPVFDSYSVTEKGSPNPFANIDVNWDVSDTDGNLDTVLVEVFDADTGSLVDSTTNDVSGSSASGLDEFKIRGRGETYDVTTTVTDTAGASNSKTQTVSE